MQSTQARANQSAGAQVTLAGQLAAAMERGVSALVISPADSAALLTETTARLSASRTRVLRVRPPYNLTSFMRQIAPSASDDSLIEDAYKVLASLDPAYDVIALIAEDAHMLPRTTLRYIETSLRTIPHLCVALVGLSNINDLLVEHNLADLQKKLSLHLSIYNPTANLSALEVPSVTSDATLTTNSRSWRLRTLGGVALAVCIGLVGAFLLDQGSRGVSSSDVVQQQHAPRAGASPATVQDVPSAAAPSALAAAPPVTASPLTAVAPLIVAPAPPLPASPLTAIAPPVVPTAPPQTASPPIAVTPAIVAAAPLAVAVAAPPVPEPIMVSLSGGEFLMGSNDDPSERPPHNAWLAPFLLSEKAVTVLEWQICVDAKVCQAVSNGRPDEPVTNVNLEDARGYATWLSQSTTQPYRLPTEAEWEYAARAGATTRYPWGNTMVPGRASCKGCGEAASLQKPPAVDAYPPNSFGLFGMGGGAAEWVSDCWHRNYKGAPIDGSVPWGALYCREHVLRGGSWMEDAGSMRVSSRDFYDNSVRYPTHGFRVARSK